MILPGKHSVRHGTIIRVNKTISLNIVNLFSPNVLRNII